MSDKPDPVLNLDSLVKDHESKAEKDAAQPFILKGVGPEKVDVTFMSPHEMDWEEAQDIATAFQEADLRYIFINLIEDNEQLEAWFEAGVPGEVAGTVLEKYMKHHGWDFRRGQRMNREQRRRA